jgi:bifunctional DNA-binding transcriptional regulator/antitoxin component of YhaV-PrlF toxin-antitoxin module
LEKEEINMPQNEWIVGANLVPENKTYRVDSSGRVIIPSHLRSKFRIEVGDEMEYYTTFADNSWFLCIKLDAKAQAAAIIAAAEAKAAEEALIEEAKNEANI